MGFERRLTQRRVRKLTRDVALVGFPSGRAVVALQNRGVFMRTGSLDTRRSPAACRGIACRIPRSGKVTARSGRWLQPIVCRLVDGHAIPPVDFDVVDGRGWSGLRAQARPAQTQ